MTKSTVWVWACTCFIACSSDTFDIEGLPTEPEPVAATNCVAQGTTDADEFFRVGDQLELRPLLWAAGIESTGFFSDFLSGYSLETWGAIRCLNTENNLSDKCDVEPTADATVTLVGVQAGAGGVILLRMTDDDYVDVVRESSAAYIAPPMVQWTLTQETPALTRVGFEVRSLAEEIALSGAGYQISSTLGPAADSSSPIPLRRGELLVPRSLNSFSLAVAGASIKCEEVGPVGEPGDLMVEAHGVSAQGSEGTFVVTGFLRLTGADGNLARVAPEVVPIGVARARVVLNQRVTDMDGRIAFRASTTGPFWVRVRLGNQEAALQINFPNDES